MRRLRPAESLRRNALLETHHHASCKQFLERELRWLEERNGVRPVLPQSEGTPRPASQVLALRLKRLSRG